MSKTNIIAIGRSRYLYDGIRHLLNKGYSFKAIVTEEAYEEYDIKHTISNSWPVNAAPPFHGQVC